MAGLRARRSKYGAVPTLTEKQVQRQIVDYLRRVVRAEVYVLGTVRRNGDHPGTMQTPGLPDLWAFLPHPLHCGLWIEVKRPGGKRSPAQDAFADSCAKSFHTNYVCGGLDDVQAWLSRVRSICFQCPDGQTIRET